MSPRLREICVLLLVLSCGPGEPAASPAAISVVDDAGRRVALAAPPARIVSLAPGATEILLALGAEDRIVARTAYDQDPRLASLPAFGETLTPSAEGIVELEPDLVVAWLFEADPSPLRRLGELGVPLYLTDDQTLADVATTIERLGALVGRAGAADSIVTGLGARIERVRARAAGRSRPDVLYLVWHDPPLTAGSGSYLDEIVAAAGGRNAFGDLRRPWVPISLEEIVRRDPDWIVVPAGRDHDIPLAEVVRARPWRDLRAVREGRVATVASDLFNRPGPRVAEAVEALAAILHPEAAP